MKLDTQRRQTTACVLRIEDDQGNEYFRSKEICRVEGYGDGPEGHSAGTDFCSAEEVALRELDVAIPDWRDQMAANWVKDSAGASAQCKIRN